MPLPNQMMPAMETLCLHKGLGGEKAAGLLTCRDSWKEAAWYWAYLAMVVCDLLLSQGHTCCVPARSQFSSDGCCTCVRTSTVCSPLASTKVLVLNRPRSEEESTGGADISEERRREGAHPPWQGAPYAPPRRPPRAALPSQAAHSLRRRDPASPRMTVMGFLGSVQNCSKTGEKASRLLSS